MSTSINNDILKVSQEEYAKCLDTYIDKVSKSQDIAAIYKIGNTNVAGISDLDLILVMRNKLEKKASFYSIADLDERSNYIFMHEPFVMDEQLFKNTSRIYFISQYQRIYGTELRRDEINAQEAEIFNILIIIESMVTNALGLLERMAAQNFSARASLATFSSMTHTLNMVAALFGKMPLGGEDFIRVSADLKNNWFLHPPSDERQVMIRKLISQELILTFDVLTYINRMLVNRGYIRESSNPDRHYIMAADQPNKFFIFSGSGLRDTYLNKSLELSCNLPDSIPGLKRLLPKKLTHRYIVVLPQGLGFIFEVYARAQGIISSALRKRFLCSPEANLVDSCIQANFKRALEKKAGLLNMHADFLKRNDFNFGMFSLARFYPRKASVIRRLVWRGRDTLLKVLHQNVKRCARALKFEQGITAKISNWLLDCRYRTNNNTDSKDGGFYLCYSIKENKGSILHTEISAYASLLFANLYTWFSDERYLNLAKQTAKFILGMQGEDGAFSFGVSKDDKKSAECFSFDAGICATALIRLYSLTKKDEYLRCAERAGQWLISQAQNKNGSFRAVYDRNKGDFIDAASRGFWGDNCVLHAKLAIPFLKLHEATGNHEFRTAAHRACEWVLNLQDGDGFFKTSLSDAQIYTHVNCYVGEGLISAYSILKEVKYLAALKRLGDWLRYRQAADGSLGWVYRPSGLRQRLIAYKATGPLAQAIRVWLFLYYLTGEHEYHLAAIRAKNFLISTVKHDKDQAYIASFILDFFNLRYCNPNIFTWTNMFAAQAIYQLENVGRQNGLDKMFAELN